MTLKPLPELYLTNRNGGSILHSSKCTSCQLPYRLVLKVVELRRLLSLLYIALLSTALLAHEAPTTSPSLFEQQLAADQQSSLISADMATIYRAMAILEPQSLPQRYSRESADISKCATDALVEAFAVINANPELYGSYAKMFMARPQTQFYIESPQGYFRLFFDLTGLHAVPTADNDSSGIPDFIERAANLADSVWSYELDQLAHLKPPVDNGQGGSDQYDIYFQKIPYYGYTTPESPGPEPWNDYASHIVIHSTFSPGFPPNEDPEGDVMGALKVTIAHEFYHAVQFAYDVSEASFFMEMSSTWMEEMAFPQVNDNYNYLPEFFNYPEVGLQAGDFHRYASFVWPKYLEERFGAIIMRDLWAKCRTTSAIVAWGAVIDSAGSSFEREFTRFVLWNYYTNTRSTGTHYESAPDYPPVDVMAYHYDLPDSGNFSVTPPQPYASNYIVFENLNGYDGIVGFDFTGLNATTWTLAYVVDYGDGNYFDSLLVPLAGGKAKVWIADFRNVLRVTFIPAVAAHFGTEYNFTYHLHFRRPGDVDGDTQISISDAVFLINWIFAGGATPYPNYIADVNCDGIGSISDAVHLISYIFAGGPPPCQY